MERSIGSLRLSSVRRALVWACCNVWDDDYRGGKRGINDPWTMHSPASSRCSPSFSHKRQPERETTEKNHALDAEMFGDQLPGCLKLSWKLVDATHIFRPTALVVICPPILSVPPPPSRFVSRTHLCHV